MTDSQVQKTVLKNGIRVVTESLPDRDSATVGVWVEVGSRHEADQVAGISHFLEHMVFKGTPTRSAKEIASAIERLGGSLNAFTSREHTCFYARVLYRDMPTAIDILSDIATRAKLPNGELNKERYVIAEEIKDAHDTPHEWVHELFTNQLWPNEPIGRPIAGSLDTVMKMTRRNLQDHRRNYYRPDRIVIAVGGRVSHASVVRQVRSAFGLDTPSKPAPDLVSPNGIATMRGVAERDINQTHVCIGVPTWRFADARRHTTLLTSNVLGGGMSSRLFQTVREKHGLVYAVYTFHDAFQDTGFFGVYFACDPKNVVKASNLVLGELGKLIRRPVGAVELHDVKAQLRGNLLLGLESTSQRTHRLARHELYLGGYVPPSETLRSIERIRQTDVSAFAKEAFQPERVAAAILGPVTSETIGKIDWDQIRPSGPRKAKSK